MERFDTLKPPFFEKTGQIKDIAQALEDRDWLGTFNLWIMRSKPQPSIIYQQRSPDATWEPLKLDVSAGGYYHAGEELADGLREVQEELGKTYSFGQVHVIGRRLNVSHDTKGRLRQTVVDIALMTDDSPLESYKLQPEEVHAIFECPIDELLKVHRDESYAFMAKGLDNKGDSAEIRVDRNSFPKNWDDYHHKIALLSKRFLEGDKDIIY